MTTSQKVRKIAQILIKEFPSLNLVAAVEIAHKIIEAIDE